MEAFSLVVLNGNAPRRAGGAIFGEGAARDNFAGRDDLM